MKRWVKRCLWCLSGLVAVPALIVLGLVARLALAPISLGPFADFAARKVDAALLDIDLDFADIVISWDKSAKTLEFHFRDVALEMPGGADGDPKARVPELSIVYSLSSILSGRIHASHVLIRHPVVHAEWSADSLIAFLSGTAGDTSRAVSFDAPELMMVFIDSLTGRYEPNGFYAGLETVRIEEGVIALTETGTGIGWRIPDADLQFGHSASGLRIAGSGSLLAGDESKAGAFSFAATTKGNAGLQGVDLRLDMIRLPVLAREIPAFAVLAGINMPLDADLGIDVGPRPERSVSMSLTVKADAGDLRLPPWYDVPRAFDGIDLAALYDSKNREIELTGLAAHLNGTTFFVSGHMVDGDADLPAISLRGGFSRLSLDALTAYWPDTIVRGGRRWIAENLSEGVIKDGTLVLDMAEGDWGAGPVSADRFRLDFTFDGLTAHVLRPMPPILDAYGRGRLTASGLTLHVDGGLTDGLPVAGSMVELTGFDRPGPQSADILLRMNGAVPDILRFIDHEPLGYARAFGIAPDALQGMADLEAALSFPLIKALSMNDVDIAVGGQISALYLPDIFGKRPLSDGNLTLAVTREGLQARGTGQLGPAELFIDWHENFLAGPDENSSRFDVHTRLTKQDLKTLIVDPRDYFEGDLTAAIVLEGNGPKILYGTVKADLTQSLLNVPELGWQKPVGETANLDFSLNFTTAGQVTLHDMQLKSGTGSLEGQMILDGETGAFQKARIDRLSLGLTDLSGSVLYGEDRYTVRLNGRSFDARPILEQLNAPQQKDTPKANPLPDMTLALSFDSVVGLREVEFNGLEASGIRDDAEWQLLNLRMSLSDGSAIAADIVPLENEPARQLTLTVDNAGQVLKGLGLYPNISGGALGLDARLLNDRETITAEGTARLTDFRLVQSLTLDVPADQEKISGFDEFVGSDGLSFTDMRLPFTVENGIIDIDGAHANGPNLGLTLEGQIDERLEQVNMNGLLVPAYGLNALLGKIPLVGGLFSGGAGGGMFALSYRVMGSTENPEVSVNPLTIFMPGILRKPFEGSKGTLDNVPSAPVEKNQKPDPEMLPVPLPDGKGTKDKDGSKTPDINAFKPAKM